MKGAAATPLPSLRNTPSERAQTPYRIMVVDDSAVIRGLLVRTLESDPDIAVVASVGDGQMALNALSRHDVEIVILDIEMPVMDGLTALPRIIAAKSGIQVLMASSLTQRGADISFRALAAGAADYVTKPSSSFTTASAFKTELVAKVKALAFARRKSRGEAQPNPSANPSPIPAAPSSLSQSAGHEFTLRPFADEPPSIVAIGSSTGGPQALFNLLAGLKRLRQPILITQHMPATFTTILGEHITRSTGIKAAEAVDGEPVEPGRVYIAPGDFHMVVEIADGRKRLRVTRTAPENFCRPSVDPMLRSLAQAYRQAVLAVILTGMGQDGQKGGEAVVAAGGTVIAQDEATSVVWGMPGAVAMAGLCSAVLPLNQLGQLIVKLSNRGNR